PDQITGHALAFVGRTLRNDEPLNPEVAERLQALWISRLAAAREGTPMEHALELGAFGWWFGRQKLDEAWALVQLLAVLRLGVRPEPMHVVMDRLPEVAAT